MSHEVTIRKAMDMANAGQARQAAQLLWPLMARASSRDDTLYAVAYCFEQADSVVTAAYLYQELLAKHPDHQDAAERFSRCDALANARGLLEDFHDMGHRSCDICELRFRAEFGRCPYCGTHTDASIRYEEEGANEDLPGWEDPTLSDHIHEIGLDAVEKVQGIMESEELQQLSEKIQESGQKAVTKAKEISKRAEVKEAAARTEEKVDALVKHRAVQDAAQKIEDLGWMASEKVKKVTHRKEIRETSKKARKLGREAGTQVRKFIKRDDVQDASNRMKKMGKQWSKKLKEALDSEPGKDSK